MDMTLLAMAVSQGNHPMAKMLREMIAEYESDIRNINNNVTPFTTITSRHCGPVIDKELRDKIHKVSGLVPRNGENRETFAYTCARIACRMK